MLWPASLRLHLRGLGRSHGNHATVNPAGHVAIVEDIGRMREALSFQLGTTEWGLSHIPRRERFRDGSAATPFDCIMLADECMPASAQIPRNPG